LTFIFRVFRDGILKTAKELVDGTKALVAAAASNQDQLVTAANEATETITRLADGIKLGSAALGSHQPDAQVIRAA
jgi:talin